MLLREIIFSVQAMLGEVRRLVNSLLEPLQKPFLLLLFCSLLHHFPLLTSPWAELVSVSRVVIFPQVVHKRKKGRTAERQKVM